MAIFLPWGGKKREAVSADFDHALTQEILRTELIRIKALIATAAGLGAILWTIYIFEPEAISRVWMGHLKPSYLYVILVPFILFELWVHAVISRHLKLNHDIPKFRRYLGAFIETSMPTVALALHIDNMGSVQALGFVAPFMYFIFIILSTLRLDFWLSTFTGFVAAAELFGMAMFYHPVGSTGPPPDLYYHSVRSMVVLICGMLAGAVGVQLRRQFEASILAATARDRVTNLFGQHVSPQVVERLLAAGWYGEYDAAVMAEVAASGYLGASTTRTGVASSAGDPYELRRITILRGDGVAGLSRALAAVGLPH
jgi:adenylate cyclase